MFNMFNMYQGSSILFLADELLVELKALSLAPKVYDKNQRWFVCGEVLQNADFNTLRPNKWIADNVRVEVDVLEHLLFLELILQSIVAGA